MTFRWDGPPPEPPEPPKPSEVALAAIIAGVSFLMVLLGRGGWQVAGLIGVVSSVLWLATLPMPPKP